MLRQLLDKYRQRWREEPTRDEDLVLHLGDSAHRACWSAVSGRIPTFRTGSGKLWVASKNRWLVGREKMACLGLPVTEGASSAMGTPTLKINDVARADHISGNAMHFSTVGVCQMVALCCFAKTECAYPMLDMYKSH